MSESARVMRRVVIAGISGGIGKALASELLANAGVEEIIGLCRQPGELELPECVKDRTRILSWQVTADSAAELAASLATVLSAKKSVDTVIYCIGVLHGPGFGPEKRLEELDAAAMAQAFQINATGFAMLIQALKPWLSRSGYVRIAALSAKVGSISDNRLGGWYTYRASKAALNMLVRGIAIEMGRVLPEVACVAIHPGTTITPLSKPFTRSLETLQVHSAQATAQNIVRQLQAVTPADNGSFINWDGARLPW